MCVCVCGGGGGGVCVCGAYMRGTEGESLLNTFCLCLGRSSSSRGCSESVGDVMCVHVCVIEHEIFKVVRFRGGEGPGYGSKF